MSTESEILVADDRELVRRIAAGDVAAFRDLYDRHSPSLLAFIRSRLGTTDSADELHNEVWMKLYRKPPAGADQHVRGWLFLVARREVINWWRREQRNPDQLPEDAEARLSAPQMLAKDDERRRSDLEDCLGRLSAEFREVVSRTMLGQTHLQIAKELAIPENTSYTRFGRAKVKLKDCMERKGWSA